LIWLKKTLLFLLLEEASEGLVYCSSEVRLDLGLQVACLRQHLAFGVLGMHNLLIQPELLDVVVLGLGLAHWRIDLSLGPVPEQGQVSQE
jgi:hypothetical protein